MKIKDIINNKKVTVSFEVFPPKQWDKIANTKKWNTTLETLRKNGRNSGNHALTSA